MKFRAIFFLDFEADPFGDAPIWKDKADKLQAALRREGWTDVTYEIKERRDRGEDGVPKRVRKPKIHAA